MPGIATALRGEYLTVQAALPGRPPENVGILLLDPQANRLHVRFRRDWESVADDDEDVEVFEHLSSDLAAKAEELGARELLEWLEDHCSHAIRVSERESLAVESFEHAAARIYRKHVEPTVLPFRTHLPVYSLQAAAGKFGNNMEVEAEGWEEIPDGLRLTEDLFVAHVTGRSMEPKIPDGSLCVFRYGVTGSRQGRLVLVENYGETGENRYTIKRYRSFKQVSEESFEHERIVLEPLNPEYSEWDLTPDSPIRVIAEFVQVL